MRGVHACREVSFDEGAGIVDEDIKSPEPIGDSIQHGDPGRVDSHVSLDCQRIGVRVGEAVEGRLRSTANSDGGALFQIGFSQAHADTRCAASYKNNLFHLFVQLLALKFSS
nr:hypothetical protein [Parvibaculum sp.]